MGAWHPCRPSHGPGRRATWGRSMRRARADPSGRIARVGPASMGGVRPARSCGVGVVPPWRTARARTSTPLTRAWPAGPDRGAAPRPGRSFKVRDSGQAMVASEILSMGHARVLPALERPAPTETAARQAVVRGLPGRKIESLVRRHFGWMPKSRPSRGSRRAPRYHTRDCGHRARVVRMGHGPHARRARPGGERHRQRRGPGRRPSPRRDGSAWRQFDVVRTGPGGVSSTCVTIQRPETVGRASGPPVSSARDSRT